MLDYLVYCGSSSVLDEKHKFEISFNQLKKSKMRSVFYQSRFHSTQLIFSNYQRYSQPILNAKKQGVTNLCNTRDPHSTLMIGCTCRIHLGIQWPRIRCSRAYAQHQLGMFQGLCPTLPILIFSCTSELHARHKCFITQVLERFSLNTNIK